MTKNMNSSLFLHTMLFTLNRSRTDYEIYFVQTDPFQNPPLLFHFFILGRNVKNIDFSTFKFPIELLANLSVDLLTT